MNTHFLSIIIPIYKQEKTIKKDILNIDNTLQKIRYPYEIIAIVDGKNEDNSYKICQQIKRKNLKIYTYKHNHGKGHAIRFGMTKTKGDYIAFIDAGMEIDPNGISMLLEHLEWYDADIIVGSKRHPASLVNYPIDRKIISFFVYLISRTLFNLKIRDTQAGVKIFKRKVLEKVLPRLLVKSFAFDLEILAVSKHLGFKRIYEAPIKLNYDFDNLHLHNSMLKTIYKTFIDTLAIFYRLRILRYYNDSNKRKWKFNPDLQLRINTGQ
ncbi:glycosyltransferase [Patescibacteria group bacterium]|nr:glycosyltransferase [Patescibacteria group bacterium]MCG2702077.1 glycosyltransferase [Candidatus Parcubacteria bacterium]MBU4265139.1 glycosyltransferase [Patescibacteria group bacterium]MBU4390703.1 glycosyltransferase [Patescibacteria group bacterium]MBU4397675.1 glycosyltransferase [Patescibacteria group bacterium]